MQLFAQMKICCTSTAVHPACVRTEIGRGCTLVHKYCKYFLNCLGSFDSFMLQELPSSQLPTPIIHTSTSFKTHLKLKKMTLTSPQLLVRASARCDFKDNPELRMARVLLSMEWKLAHNLTWTVLEKLTLKSYSGAIF